MTPAERQCRANSLMIRVFPIPASPATNSTWRLPELDRGAVLDPESERFRLFPAVDQLFSSASQCSPLLVLLDDLHWADKSSLLLLRHLARGAPSTAMFLIGTYRGDGVERTALGLCWLTCNEIKSLPGWPCGD
jgi:hypothetical protein